MTALENLSETTRRGLCLAMSVAIVGFALIVGSMTADAAYADAARAHVYVVQLA
ncbi:MAG TPA: hypothetical protein VHK24_01665 [Steroidobacter sp.]|jgi:hypothetical protein|nr:hypothetical protein [Steroidobacter sp.]